MKKLISLFLILTLCFSMFAVNASAFGGYAHWYMGTTIVSDSAFDDKTDDVKLAYISGSVLADIGEAGLNDNALTNGYTDIHNDDYDGDTTTTESDNFLATSKVYELSRSLNARSRAMAYGWRDHYIQDNLGDVYNNTGTPYAKILYPITCGWIDEYLRDEVASINYPIQSGDTSAIYIGYTLIENLFQEIYAVTLSPEMIVNEIVQLFALYDANIAANMLGWTQNQRLKINNELTRVMDLCYGIKASTPVYLRNSSTSTTTNTLYYNRDTLAKEQFNALITEKELETLSKFVQIEENKLSNDEAIIYISTTDKEGYNRSLELICSEKLKTIDRTLTLK